MRDARSDTPASDGRLTTRVRRVYARVKEYLPYVPILVLAVVVAKQGTRLDRHAEYAKNMGQWREAMAAYEKQEPARKRRHDERIRHLARNTEAQEDSNCLTCIGHKAEGLVPDCEQYCRAR